EGPRVEGSRVDSVGRAPFLLPGCCQALRWILLVLPCDPLVLGSHFNSHLEALDGPAATDYPTAQRGGAYARAGSDSGSPQTGDPWPTGSPGCSDPVSSIGDATVGCAASGRTPARQRAPCMSLTATTRPMPPGRLRFGPLTSSGWRSCTRVNRQLN